MPSADSPLPSSSRTHLPAHAIRMLPVLALNLDLLMSDKTVEST